MDTTNDTPGDYDKMEQYIPTREEYRRNAGMDRMLMRDYFAAKAMQGHWASMDTDSALDWIDPNGKDHHTVARCAYVMADAMLKAREE